MSTRFRNPGPIGWVILLAVVCAPSVESHGSIATSRNPVASKLAAPLVAVVRLIVEERINPLIDNVLQNAPPAARLGNRWGPSNPAWQQARASFTGRIERIADWYRDSGDFVRTLESELKKLTPDSEAALASALNGPAGPAILRQLARMQFTVMMMADDPNGPRPGGNAWQEKVRELQSLFDRRIGPALPPDDPRHAADVEKFLAALSSDVSGVCFSTVAAATNELAGAINLILFDDSDAIRQEIETVIARVR